MSNETSTNGQSLTSDHANAVHIPKIFVVCDRSDTAPVWGYILRQQGLVVILESSFERAIDRWIVETPDLVVIDVDADQEKLKELYEKFRAISLAPLLLFLPTHHETQILEAYAAGVDEVIVKPISPAIFLAKIMAWVRRSWSFPVNGLSLVSAGEHQLDPKQHCLIDPDGSAIKLTNLEFQLLHLLMSQPGYNFHTDNIIRSVWGSYGYGDAVLLKNVVYRLRKKIEPDSSHPALLQTWSGGYSFQG